MKSAIFYNICLGFASVTRVVAVPVDSELQELVKRQQGKQCHKDFEGVTVIEEIVDDNTGKSGNVTEFASPGYPGACETGNQICQFFWRDGNFVCRAICHCPVSSYCSVSGSYCFYQPDNGVCYCT